MTDPTPPWRLLDADDDARPPGAPAQTPTVSGPTDTTRLRTLGLLGAAAVVAVAGLVLALGGEPGSVAVDGGGAAPSAPPDGTSSPVVDAPSTELVVEVAGAVREPGLFRVAPGTRVGDLIAMAGGYGPRVDAIRVDAELNLAALVTDGQRVRVPSRDDPATALAPTPGTAGPADPAGAPSLIDLNTATLEQLDTLPGIGPVTAEKIIAAREEAPFAAVEELRSRGILGEKTYEEVRPLVAVP